MRRLEPRELLDLLDAYREASAPVRSAALVALCCPDPAAGAHTPGTRNARLMAIRHANLGRWMACLTPCPACGETLELELDMLDFAGVPSATHVELEYEGDTLAFRLPGVAEIEAAARSGTPARLLEELAIDLPPGVDLGAPALLDEVSAAFDAADPLGCIVMESLCPACGTLSRPPLDPLALVWHELASVAQRLEDEVHVLARAYGWSEHEILALPDARRRRYVDRFAA
jgi:hypothetical protein